MTTSTEQENTMKTKRMVLIKGKGTKDEQRVVTSIDLYWSKTLKMWVTIPS